MATIKELEKQVATLQGEKDELTTALNNSKQENAELEKRIEALNSKLLAKTKEVSTLKKAITTIKAQLKKALNPNEDGTIKLINGLSSEVMSNLAVKIRTTQDGIKAYTAIFFGKGEEKPVRRNVHEMTKELLESERTMQ